MQEEDQVMILQHHQDYSQDRWKKEIKGKLKYCYLWVDFAGTKEIRQLSKFIQGVSEKTLFKDF